MTSPYTLGSAQRLKSRRQIDELFSRGKRIPQSPWLAFYRLQPLQTATAPALVCGFTASKRQFKKAVDRNRIKRLTREAWRLQKGELEKKLSGNNICAQVFLVYTGKELPEFELAKSKIAALIQKLSKYTDENFPAHT